MIRLWWTALVFIIALGVAGWVASADAQPASVAPLAPPQAAPPPAPAAPAQPAPAPVTPEFAAGFCGGWNMSVQITRQRYDNWRALATAGRTDEGARTQVGQAIDVMTNSIPVYVLPQLLPGGASVVLGDGRTVVCPAEGGAK